MLEPTKKLIFSATDMTTRSILGLLYILRGMSAIGEQTEHALAKFGLKLAQLDPSAQIHRELELDIYIALAQDLRLSHAGLKVGQYFSLAGYGPFVMLLLTCQTIRDAVRIGVGYQALTFLYSRLSVEHQPKTHQSALVLAPYEALDEPARRFLVDCEMAGTFKLLRDLQATFIDVSEQVRVELPIPMPDDPQIVADYQQYYGHHVSFGHRVGRFWATQHLLDQPLMTADSAGHALYLQQCDVALRMQQSQQTTLVDHVRTYLLLHEGDVPDIQTTAQAFGVVERTLRYRLAQLGVSFRQLRDEILYQKSQQYLSNPNMTIEQVAIRLGYAESAAFIHAFKRWSGVSPHRFRQNKNTLMSR
jgi:AraC-like DNA-binding protein